MTTKHDLPPSTAKKLIGILAGGVIVEIIAQLIINRFVNPAPAPAEEGQGGYLPA